MSQNEVIAAKMKVYQDTENLNLALNRLTNRVNTTIDLVRHPRETVQRFFALASFKNHPIQAWALLFIGGLAFGLILRNRSYENPIDPLID